MSALARARSLLPACSTAIAPPALVPHRPLQKSNPQVSWVQGQRYVEDGTNTTSAGDSSGISASLHLVQELAGQAESAKIAGQGPLPTLTDTTALFDVDSYSSAARLIPVSTGSSINTSGPRRHLRFRRRTDRSDIQLGHQRRSVDYPFRPAAADSASPAALRAPILFLLVTVLAGTVGMIHTLIRVIRRRLLDGHHVSQDGPRRP